MKSRVDISEVVKAIDKELKGTQSSRIQNAAINKGAEKVADNTSKAFAKFKGTKYSTGATADEVVVQRSRKTQYGRAAKVGWSGPKERYRLIHLNEWGYTRKGKTYRPRMMGTVQKSLDQSEREYFDIVGKELQKGYARHVK